MRQIEKHLQLLKAGGLYSCFYESSHSGFCRIKNRRKTKNSENDISGLYFWFPLASLSMITVHCWCWCHPDVLHSPNVKHESKGFEEYSPDQNGIGNCACRWKLTFFLIYLVVKLRFIQLQLIDWLTSQSIPPGGHSQSNYCHPQKY